MEINEGKHGQATILRRHVLLGQAWPRWEYRQKREQTLKPSIIASVGPKVTGSLQGSTIEVVFLHLHLLQ